VVDKIRSVSDNMFLSAARLARFDSFFMPQGDGEPLTEASFIWRPSTQL